MPRPNRLAAPPWLRALLPASLALALLAPARAAETGGPRIAKLRLEGARAVDPSEILAGILTSQPDWRPWRPLPLFDPEDLEEDLARIAEIYREHGYYEARAESSVEWNERHDRARVVIRVFEGEPVRLADWQLAVPEPGDLPSGALDPLLARLPEPGSVFGVRVYRAVRARVLGRMADLGHPAASLEGGAEVDLATHSARVEWTLRAGPTVRVGAIRITGLEDVAARIVRRELALAPGDRFSRERLGRSQRRIFDTGLFRSVAIQPLESEATTLPPSARAGESEPEVVWPLEIRVVERSPRSFSIGAGYGTEDDFRARADWTHRNFLGNGRRLEIAGKYSSLLFGVEARLAQPYFLEKWLDDPLRAALRLSAIRETPRAYAANRLVEGIELERGLGHGLTLRFGQSLEWAKVTSQRIEEDLGADLPESSRLHTLPVGLRFSHLDDPIHTTRGAWLDLSVEPSIRAIGSQVDYAKLVAEARGFVPLGPVVLAARYRMGTLEPFAGSAPGDVPIFKRFYAGGSTSVRGFAYQKLGPVDGSGNPLGGLSWAEGSVELRFPIWKALSGVLFSDAGQVNLEPSDWSGHDIFYSSGVGLRLATPVGPVRADVARLYNPPDGSDRYGYYVSVGHTF